MTLHGIDPVLARETIDTIRLLAADAVEAAQSGHPGTPMEAAPLAYLLYRHHLRHNPANPDWAGRDRFILSCGHASTLLYSVLHLSGYDLPLDALKNFRQFGSRTAGHPEFGHCPGVETTTGPLGQGVAVATGMAMGSRFLRDRVNAELFSSRIYTICSDGDLMEGVAAEAVSLAGHLSLGNLICLYLDNKITIEGTTDIAFTEDTGARFLACGWHVQRVEGENLAEVNAAIERAKHDPRPSLIVTRTHIAQGAPTKQDTPDAHGAPLGAAELKATKIAYGRDPEASFVIPDAVKAHMAALRETGAALEADWNRQLADKLRPGSPLDSWLQASKGVLPAGWEQALPTFTPADGKIATRSAGGKVLNAIAGKLPFLVGGSADLGPSNNTTLKGEESFTACSSGRNIHYGVREHAMGAIMNGLCHTPGLKPFGGTFLIFADYMRPPMRLAAMMGLAPVYVLTHDSIGLGEDGPTHQPVEQLANLRAVPNMVVLRPADANETVEAWKVALTRNDGPTVLALSRQGLPVLDRGAAKGNVAQGGYVLSPEQGALQAILIATGSEVSLALEAQQQLQQEGLGVRVVSLPSWELFEQQDSAYRDSVLPPTCTKRVAVEAASTFGWERYVGRCGRVVGMTGFGASAPIHALMQHFGFTADNVAAQVRELLG